ncbi:MAG: hypothetical protein K8S16_07985, partial [Bacteroidales bacterium]|nr:hypothetical protein [Bacteroidales bacterium]
MKNLTAFFFLLIANALFAQNWSPILVNQKMNYQHSDSSYISHTIWVDSAFYFGDDSIFYLNRVVKDVPDNPEIALRNQPQFLGEYLVKQEFGFYLIGDPFQYRLYAIADLGNSWMFAPLGSISAEVTEIYTEDIFGITDSVKVISLTDGNELKLSKNFGLLKYPDFENGGYYELVGIQDTEYGESVPGFWEMFDFEVGDVFQYYYEAGGSGTGMMDLYTNKLIILSKTIDPDQIIYETEGIRSGYAYNVYNPGEYYYYSYLIEDDLLFTYNPEDIPNKYNNELITLEEFYCGLNDPPISYAALIPGIDSNSFITKHYGTYELYGDPNLFYTENPLSDTLIMFPDIFLCFSSYPSGITYTDRLGVTYYYQGFEEDMTEYNLVGYIKNGDTVGTITPDSVLLAVSIDENINGSDNTVTVYPNPADDWLNIKITNPNSRHIYNFELRNLFGQLVRK